MDTCDCLYLGIVYGAICQLLSEKNVIIFKEHFNYVMAIKQKIIHIV